MYGIITTRLCQQEHLSRPMLTTESAEGTSITPMISNSLESPITPMTPTSSEKPKIPCMQPGQTIKRILATYDETSATTIKRIKSTTTATSIIPPWRQKPPATPLRRTTTPTIMTPVQPAFPPPNYLLQKEQPRSWAPPHSWTPPHSRLRRI